MPAGQEVRSPLLGRYLEIEEVAREMLEAGRADNWTRVGELQARIRTLADGVACAGGAAALPLQEQRLRMLILKRLILLDGDLRRLAHPTNRWLDQMFDTRGGRPDSQCGRA